MKAIIWDFTASPKHPLMIAEVILDESTGEALIVTDKPNLRKSLIAGVIGRLGVEYTPDQGADYINALPFQFNSGYCRAEVIA